MNKTITKELFDNPKLLKQFMENSYWIKELNRNPKIFKEFQSQMKALYKERTTDKINEAINTIDMVSSIIETLN